MRIKYSKQLFLAVAILVMAGIGALVYGWNRMPFNRKELDARGDFAKIVQGLSQPTLLAGTIVLDVNGKAIETQTFSGAFDSLLHSVYYKVGTITIIQCLGYAAKIDDERKEVIVDSLQANAVEMPDMGLSQLLSLLDVPGSNVTETIEGDLNKISFRLPAQGGVKLYSVFYNPATYKIYSIQSDVSSNPALSEIKETGSRMLTVNYSSQTPVSAGFWKEKLEGIVTLENNVITGLNPALLNYTLIKE
jgi:hypothetical protein